MQIVLAEKTAVGVPNVVVDAETLFVAYLAGYSNEKTRRAYARDLRHWATWCETIAVGVLDARRVHVDAYMRACEHHGTADATIARRLSAISGYYDYAVDEDLIARNPVGRVKRPKVRDESPTLGLDREEVGRLLAAAEGKPRDLALVCLLLLNGLRVSEALAADVDDLATERGHRVLSVTRKGGKTALVPLAPRTAAAVDAWIGDQPQGPIFVTRTGHRLDRHAAWKTVRRLAKAAGIDKAISPHSLRHSFVTCSLEAGVALHVVQDAAGHADPRTTQRYNRARHSLDGHATYALSSYVG